MMPGDDVVMLPATHRVEVFTATARRRWSVEDKARIVAESHSTSAGEVSDRYRYGADAAIAMGATVPIEPHGAFGMQCFAGRADPFHDSFAQGGVRSSRSTPGTTFRSEWLVGTA